MHTVVVSGDSKRSSISFKFNSKEENEDDKIKRMHSKNTASVIIHSVNSSLFESKYSSEITFNDIGDGDDDNNELDIYHKCHYVFCCVYRGFGGFIIGDWRKYI